MQTIKNHISPLEQAKAGLKVFFNAVSEWELSVHEAMTLLGNPSRSRYYEYKAGNVHSVSDDFLFRLEYLSAIYHNLRRLYSRKNTKVWLKNGFGTDAKASDLSPIEYMLSNIRGVIMIYDYLQTHTSD